MQNSKQYWKSLNSDGAKEVPCVSGDVQAGMIWNGLGHAGWSRSPALEYAYPKEGFTGWMDNIVVLKGAPNPENAKLFVNFMMEPEHAAMVSNFAALANGVLDSEKLMEPELLEAPEIVIPEGASDPEFVPSCAAR